MDPTGGDIATVITGRARVVGDNINTDYIISSRRKRDSENAAQVVQYIFEDLRPPLAESLRPGDIIVAGQNFGCGSAMEIAVEALLAAGIRAVVARSFARTYYRNAINTGLLVIEAGTEAIREGDQLAITLGAVSRLRNETTSLAIDMREPAPLVLELMRYGGLIGYYRSRGLIPRGRL